MWLISLAPLNTAVQTLNVPNVSSSSQDRALATLCFLGAPFLSARFPCRLFRANALRLSLSSRCFLPKFLPSFFRRYRSSSRNTPRLPHRRHFCLPAYYALRASLPSSLRVPGFPRQRCTNFAAVGTVAARKYFVSLGCITTSWYCWQICIITTLRVPYTQYGFLSRAACFWSCSCSQKR